MGAPAASLEAAAHTDGAQTPLALALLACGAIANLLAHGFGFPGGNNVFHVAIVLDYAHSIEGPHDAFHQTLGNFVSALWPLLSTITTEANLSAVFFTVYALNRAFLLLFLYLCACEIAPERRRPELALACSAVVLLLCSAWRLSPLGDNDLFIIYLSHTQIALTLLMAAIWLMLRGNWVAAACVIGLDFNVNAFIAVWGAAMFLGGYLWTARPVRLGEPARCAIAGVVLALPTAVWIYRALRDTPAAAFDYRKYLMEFFPQHNLVHTNWRGLAIAVGVAGVLSTLVADPRLFREERQRRLVTALFAGLLAILAFGCVMPYVINSRLLYNLYPLRMDSVLILLFIVLSAVALADAASQRRFWLTLLLVFGFANGNLPLAIFVSALLAPERPYGKAVPAALLLAAAAFVVASGESLIYLQPATALAAAIVLAQCVVALVALWQTPLRQGALVLCIALAAPALLTDGGAWRHVTAFIYIAAAIALFGSASSPATTRAVAMLEAPLRLARVIALPTLVAVALVAGALQAARTGTLNHLPDKERAFTEAAVWLRLHSQPDALVLPLTGEVKGFSTLSRRPVWIDGRMGAAAMWSPDFYPTWHTRMQEVRALQDGQQVADYAARHGISYIVAPLNQFAASNRLETIYQNRHYKIARPR